MIIGIDANALTREHYTGTERYLHALLLHMMREPLRAGERVVLYTSSVVSSVEPLPEGWSWKIVKWPLKKGWTHGGLSRELLRDPPDVFFTPVHEIPLFYRRTKIVNTVHDVAFAVEPKTYSWKARLRQQWAVRRAVRKADLLLAVSQTTADDLARLYGVSSNKMIITPLAINKEEFDTKCSDRDKSLLDDFRLYSGRYFLSIGRIEEKKNIGFLLQAFFEYKKRRGIGDPTQLILAGKMGDGARRFEQMIAQSPFASSVKLLGFISDEQKRALFAGALAYLFPSRYEGFGLPALEAFAADCPLLASDIPALREVAGEAALFAPTDGISAWAQNMERVALDSRVRDDLVEKGRDRARAFSWDKTAQLTWRALRSVWNK